MDHYKSREIFHEFYYLLEKFIKNLHKWDSSWNIGNGIKILEGFRENGL